VRALAEAGHPWLGLHRGIGGAHRRVGCRRWRNPWMAWPGPLAAMLVTALAILGFLSTF
jgi:hypothetical protein